MHDWIGARRYGKSTLGKQMRDAYLKAGKRVLVVTPDGMHIERLHKSGLRIITPYKDQGTVSILDMSTSLRRGA